MRRYTQAEKYRPGNLGGGGNEKEGRKIFPERAAAPALTNLSQGLKLPTAGRHPRPGVAHGGTGADS